MYLVRDGVRRGEVGPLLKRTPDERVEWGEVERLLKMTPDERKNGRSKDGFIVVGISTLRFFGQRLTGAMRSL